MLMLHGLLDNLDLRSLSEEGGYGVDDYPLLKKKWLKKISAREVEGCA
jgi:hypothetical protein